MRNDALKIIDAALKAADPYKNTFNALKAKKYSDKVTVISVGKAACPMAKAAYDALGDNIRQGFVLTKYGHATELPDIFTVMEAGHPIPDENSVKSTRIILDAAKSLKEDDKIIFLLSGGGSSLFESPLIPLEELQKITDTMLKNGADINEINAVRKLFSYVKGGKFARYCNCSIDCFILSDVLGDNPCVIASGPCCADKDALSDGMSAFYKYFDVSAIDILTKRKIYNSFKTVGTTNANIQIIGNVESLCKGAADRAKELGYDAVIVTENLTGEAKEQTAAIISHALEFASAPHTPTVFIYGGETTVTVKGNGLGGRNQEAALEAAIKLREKQDILFFALGSDGTDGPTDAAGGFADGETYGKMLNCKIDPQNYLDNNDSYHALKTCGDLLITGPTGTNVNDIFAVMIKKIQYFYTERCAVSMENKKCVMTGATGHVGYALLLELAKNGDNPKILIRKDSKIFDGIECTKVFGDITDPASLEKAFEGADIVYHLAGMIELKPGNEDAVYRVNVTGTKNVVAACKKCGVKRLVYMSSVDTYPPLPGNQVMTELSHYDPEILEGAYAKTKAEATQYVLDSNGTDGLETVVVQPSACFGPYDFKVSSVGEMVRMFLGGHFPVTLGFGGYNFVDVRDVAKGTRSAAEKGRPGECYILCGDVMSVDKFIRTLAKVLNMKVPAITLNKGIVDIAAPIMEVYYKVTDTTPLFTRYSIRKLVSNCNFTYAKAKEELGYEPMPVEKSVKDMTDWIIETEGDPKDPEVKKRKKAAKKAAKAKK